MLYMLTLQLIKYIKGTAVNVTFNYIEDVYRYEDVQKDLQKFSIRQLHNIGTV